MQDTASLVQLLRKMAHDMRVPLNTIISTGDMLAEGVYDPLTAKQAKAITRLQRNNVRLLAILDDFIAYVKADAGEMVLANKVFDPRATIDDCLNQVRPDAEEKGLKVRLTLSENMPAMMMGDESAVKRIVLALLWNAVSHTASGEVHIQSEWTPESEWKPEKVWSITVEDTGSGISDVDRPYIFEPFWRGEARPQVPTAAAGLGLPLALAIAKVMGGDVTLKATSIRGSTFSVILPLKA